MRNRKPLPKNEARERRDRLLDLAAQARLPLADGVHEMRTIAGMTQEEFAAHRGVSARVIKELERNQGNPTVGTLNRIGEFFGLQVAFVPRATIAPSEVTQAQAAGTASQAAANTLIHANHDELLEQILLRLSSLEKHTLEALHRQGIDDASFAQPDSAPQPADAPPPRRQFRRKDAS